MCRHSTGATHRKDMCKAMTPGTTVASHAGWQGHSVTLQSQTWESRGKPNDETNQRAATAVQGMDEGRSTRMEQQKEERDSPAIQWDQVGFGNALDLGRREWINSRVSYFNHWGKEAELSKWEERSSCRRRCCFHSRPKHLRLPPILLIILSPDTSLYINCF